MNDWKHITATAAGTTTIITDRDGTLERVVVPAQKTGTASFYDTTTTAGTTAASHMFDLPNTVGTIPTSVEVGARVQHGLVVVIGGTVDFTVIFR